ncbi:cob(I)yrinic acid a,c-diamide adenosyltransferase [Candidatus Micrarchaeota archaeon]|nr:cob(I)yrinic acid a,c-diamide adenosyltransferase [Candidatus Micrarchaeota archaeon]
MGFVYVYTGDGAGKTTAALGLALRAVGHKHKVVVVQFMKGWENTGEFIIQKNLAPFYEIKQFGTREFVDLKNPSGEDKGRAEKAMNFAFEKLKEKPNVLILDEVNLACAIGLVEVKQLLELIESADEKTAIVCTGRNAPKELCERADFVTEVENIKRKKISAHEGIEY